MNEEPGAQGPGGRVRMLDIAARAGVSAATVSRTMRGQAKVSRQTRQRVLEAARELDYLTSATADGLVAGPRPAIAVIVPFITRWFFGAVTAGALDVLRERGHDVILYHLGDGEVRDRFFERMPLAGRVDGILSLSTPLTEEHTLSLRALGLPLVSVGAGVPGSPSVGIDEEGAARAAVRHLLNLRHERIALISGEADDPRFDFASSASRRRGYEQAIEEAGLHVDPRLVSSGPHGIEGGASAMARLLAGPVLPTAVFAEYDELAFGAIKALRRAGLAVPGDVSVVGIDDHELAGVLELTTVAQNAAGQGEAAARMLLQVLGREPGTPSDVPVLLPTPLVLRGTTAPPTPAPPAPAPPSRGGEGG